MAIDPEKLRTEARELLGKDQLGRAVRLYRDALDGDDEHPDLWCEMASLIKKAGREDACGIAYFRASEMYVRQGQLRHALAACKKAVDCEADIPGAKRLFGILVAKVRAAQSKEKAPRSDRLKGGLVAAAARGRVRLRPVTPQ